MGRGAFPQAFKNLIASSQLVISMVSQAVVLTCVRIWSNASSLVMARWWDPRRQNPFPAPWSPHSIEHLNGARGRFAVLLLSQGPQGARQVRTCLAQLN